MTKRDKVSKGNSEEAEAIEDKFIKVGIPGFDDLFEKGIPKGASTLVCGGPGSGKTIFCLQTLAYGASHGEKSLFLSYEESPERLRDHMYDFGWDADKLIDEGQLMIKRYDLFELRRSVEALLEQEEHKLLIDAPPLIVPEEFIPKRIAVDSLSTIAAPYVKAEATYRIYIEQLLRYFQTMGVTSFFVVESVQSPTRSWSVTKSGVEEFLADGVVLVYNLRKGASRERAIEVLKMRGAHFQRKMVPMEIVSGRGIVVYPNQKVSVV
jgi:circadian clock protein KaiC